MQIEFNCPKCKNRNLIEGSDPGAVVECPSCHTTFGTSSEFLDKEGLKYCAICGCRDLYIQKDFNRKLGVAIVIVGAVLAPFTKLISLFVCAFIDLVLYYLLPTIEICYRCHSIFRGFPKNSQHEPFNLGINDRYRVAERL
jgi:hypothetical protein